MTCSLLQYYPQAFEEVTLTNLYHYCIDHPTHLVYYVHNKGSFSTMPENELIRRRETEFLFQHGSTVMMSKQQSPPHDPKNARCNIVGMEWEPFPHWSFPSNFWMARCSYVRQLLPPVQFAQERTRMFRRLLHPFHQTTKSPLYCLTKYFAHHNMTSDENNVSSSSQQNNQLDIILGAGRWHNEVWIHSHPDVMPCDKHDTVFASTLLNFSTSSLHKKFWGGKSGLSQYEWFRMQGRLYEFYQLYQRLPLRNSSFFYQYYQGTEKPRLPRECRRGKYRNLKDYYPLREGQMR
jgi:hypothetical protein